MSIVPREDDFSIYTDGSSYSRPRAGGIGIRFITIDAAGAEAVEDVNLPGFKAATNNQMELYACIAALKEAIRYKDLSPYQRVVIHTDSLYVADNYGKALYEWSANRWRNREDRPILNADLWKQLIKMVWKCQPRRVEFRWVKGHSKDRHNRAADKLAKRSAKNPLNPPLSIVNVRRNTANKKEERGSVQMLGQRLRIRVITDEYLKPQRIYKYKYQVLSKASRYYGNVDTIFSAELLKAGHHYEVRVNKHTPNPNIVRVIRELERVK